MQKPLKRLPRLSGFFARTEMLQDTAGSLKTHNHDIINAMDFNYVSTN
ncbi:hypothetical protein MIS45_11075 [Wielerella bovis]|nr:hypothetical protein [Wielerella bovis]ULJ69263.1 hypothetical protein MIS45_11075 [Wielerella bovis]